MNKKSILQLSAFVLAIIVAWTGYTIWRASRNLVTLDVRNADVREVVQKLERQTWETIVLDENVQGKVTFNVKRVPLEVVLGILDEQISARWSVIYPLYSTSARLDSLKKVLRGQAEVSTSGWTNYANRGFFGGGGGGGFGGRGGFGGPGGPGGGDQAQNQFVSLEIINKDLPFATVAMSRYGQSRIIPEDGTTANINVKFNKTYVDTAVAKIAKQAKRSWAKIYLLRGERDRDRDRGPGQLASREEGERRRPEDGDRRREWTEMTPEEREERRLQRETMEQELKATLPAEERQKLEQAQQQREQMFQEMQNLTPEQRRERFSQMAGGPGGGPGGGGRDQRMLSRIKNTTPEQRFDRYRQFEQRRQRWQQQGGQGGRGGR